jgi:hypothetical protein
VPMDTEAIRERVRKAVAEFGLAKVAAVLGLRPDTVSRVGAGARVQRTSLMIAEDHLPRLYAAPSIAKTTPTTPAERRTGTGPR